MTKLSVPLRGLVVFGVFNVRLMVSMLQNFPSPYGD